MDVYRLKDLSVADRQSVLQGEALGVEDMAYSRPLNDEELAIQKDALSQATIKKAVAEDELKVIKGEFKERIEPLQKTIKEAITAIRTKTLPMTGKVYKLPDFENQMIHIVDDLGNVIQSRRMLPEERQLRLMTFLPFKL